MTPELRNKYDYLIVHAFATPPSLTDVDANWVDRVHRQRGFSGGCGYQAIITRHGELQHELTGHRTRPYAKTGAHVGGCGPGWNARCLGVSLAGGVKEDGRTPENNFTPEQMETLDSYIAWACSEFDIAWENVIGHRDLIKMTNAAPKACPCFSVGDWLRDAPSGLDYGTSPKPPARGDKMKVPRTYTVRDGDTLWGIANTYGSSVGTISRLSKLDTTVIQPGQKLRIRN